MTIPRHIAIIMDGNGRWAKKHNKTRTEGHRVGITAAENIVNHASNIGVEYITLYTFSSENWNRPQNEIDTLMRYILNFANKTSQDHEKKENSDIRIVVSGLRHRIPKKTLQALDKMVEATKDKKGMTVNLAIDYSGREEIADAVKNLALEFGSGMIALEDITPEMISKNLYQPDIPDPDLIIRTSGEMRLSNFLLWQSSYSEMYFTDKLWPDFDEADLELAIKSYNGRSRKFGKTSEQIENLSSSQRMIN